MTKKFTIEKVMLFRVNAEKYMDGKERSKFSYALEKMVSRTNFVQKMVQEIHEDLSTEHASVDDKGNIIYQDKNMVFKPDAKKKMDKAFREKMQTTVEVEIHKASEIPDDLRADFEDVLLPFVTVPEMNVNEEEKAA